MRLAGLIALLFVGCSGARAPDSSDPDTVEVEVEVEVANSGEQSVPPRELGPAPEGCVVQAQIPGESRLGGYPSIAVQASPAIPYFGGPNPPLLIIDLIKPDKQRTHKAVELTYPPVCAFCLPAPGSSGCDHDCRYEPFVESSFGIGRELELAGEYRITLSLENYTCELVGGEGVLVVQPRE